MLTWEIRIQKDKVFDIIDKTGKIVDSPEQTTAFTYLPETDQEKKYVAESFSCRDSKARLPKVVDTALAPLSMASFKRFYGLK